MLLLLLNHFFHPLLYTNHSPATAEIYIQHMFANNGGGGAIPTTASSSAQFLLDTALPAPPPVSCPGTCGWWPPSTSALPGTLATTTTAQQWQNQRQQLELFGGGDDEATMVELIFAHCKPCPWGTRRLPSSSSAFSSPAEVPSPSLPSSLCHPCEVPLPTIDYLFLLFHALLPFVVNHVAICHHSARRLRHSPRLLPLTLCQLGCALIELPKCRVRFQLSQQFEVFAVPFNFVGIFHFDCPHFCSPLSSVFEFLHKIIHHFLCH
ncbi:hypothetical protein niasHT_018332 [Heterodera trifolii]|uniref:Uncharacterized protein n=1 Tax=Heterodera trifolii TaxID=157864 RepID=A0ABD2L2Y0_9BILA